MRLPEAPPAALRTQALVALVVAALGLSAIESAHAWAERWHHSAAYFALSAGLTLASALAVGLVAAVLRLPAWLALGSWSGVCLGLVWGWPSGVAGALVASLALVPRPARALPGALQGICTALALAFGILKSTSFAEHLGAKGDGRLQSVGGVLVLGAVLLCLSAILARIGSRVSMPVRVLALLAIGCLCALRPRLERGDGEHRQPPPGYARSPARVEGDPRPHVFVLVLDTVRADHLSLYGYERETTPELARLVAQRGNVAVYPRAQANGTWTVPSHASLFTGRNPNEHGAHFALDGSVRVGFGIADSLPTLAEALRSGGYATLAGYGNHWLRSVRGMGRGFERYLRAPDADELPFVGEACRQRFLPGVLWEATKGCARASDVNATLLSMIEPWSQGPNPLFVFANYVDAHGPYAPPAPFRGRFAPTGHRELSEHLSLTQAQARRAELMARYDEELLYLDHHLGLFFAALERLGVLGDSWIFITADHGEAFGEHGVLEHGTTVHAEVTHVPLIVIPPVGVTLAATDDPVSLVDVAVTAAAIGGVELGGPGRDLRALASPGTHVTAIEFYGDPVKAATLGELASRPARAVLLDRYKLIAYDDAYQLYDLERDPGENVDLARALPHVVEHMRAFLPAFKPPTFRSDGEAPVPEALDALRELGYAGVTE